MPKLAFQAMSKSSKIPLEVEIFLTDRRHGFTPSEPDKWLEFEHNYAAPVAWYAMVRNIRIAHGAHIDGSFVLEVDDTEGSAEITEKTLTTEE